MTVDMAGIIVRRGRWSADVDSPKALCRNEEMRGQRKPRRFREGHIQFVPVISPSLHQKHANRLRRVIDSVARLYRSPNAEYADKR